jgi:DNA-directed RNA polymerase II subunit RPB1
MRDIVISSRIYYDINDKNTSIEGDSDFIGLFGLMDEALNFNVQDYPWILRFELDKSKMFELEISCQDISNTLYGAYRDAIHCTFSDDNAEKCIFRLRSQSSMGMDMISDLKALEITIMEKVKLKGVDNISKISMIERKTKRLTEASIASVHPMFEEVTEVVFETMGSNLLDILAHPDVDMKRTTCNKINEISEVLGIEAAREALINEIMEVLDDIKVNYRHMALLVDTITNKGGLQSIDRHGINNSAIGPFAKSSFEETTDVIIKAGIFNAVDKINGVSANVMLGSLPPCGTADTQILIDQDKFAYHDVSEEDEGVEETKNNDIFNCDNIEIGFNMGSTTMPDIPIREILVK